MSKRVGFKSPQSAADKFVAEGKEKLETPAEPLKRLTLDIPESLHKALKKKAAEDGCTMRELALKWIEEKVAG
jgi:hypothetical protein